MHRTTAWIGALALAGGLGASPAASAPPPAEPVNWITSFDEGLALAKKTQRLMLVDFWCGT